MTNTEPTGSRRVGDDAPVALRGFERSLPMALLRAREAAMSRFRPILAAHELTEQQWRVLRALDHAAADLSVGELAERTFLLGPSLSRMLVTLDDRGLITRRRAGDARRSEITISATGRRLVEHIAPESEAAYERIEAGFEPGELDRLYELLARMAVAR